LTEDIKFNDKQVQRFNIVCFATGAFSVPSMEAMYDSGLFHIVGLATKPLSYDKQGNPIITPARQFAAKYDIPIFYYEDIHSDDFARVLWLLRPDLLFVCDFGEILSKRVLKGALLGGINLHGSLLPKYRGAAPVHWAIMSGDLFTGISIIHMTPEIDAGPVIAQSPPIPIGSREDVETLENRLAEYGAGIVVDTICKMATGEQVRIIEQIQSKVSKAPRLKKEDGFVHWTDSSVQIFNGFRAMKFWPKLFTDWHRSSGGAATRLILGGVVPLDDSYQELDSEDFTDAVFVEPMMNDAKMENLAVLRAGFVDNEPHIHTGRGHKHRRPSHWIPGTVIRAEGADLLIAAGEGVVRITQVQPAGKKMMSISDFLRGYPVKPGDKLG
jgi:methionyl-tRNA formyltransferase